MWIILVNLWHLFYRAAFVDIQSLHYSDAPIFLPFYWIFGMIGYYKYGPTSPCILLLFLLLRYIWIRRQLSIKRKETFHSQSGLPSFVTPDFVAREITLLLALRQSILSSKDTSGVIAAIISYAQAHSRNSLLHYLWRSRSLFENLDVESDVTMLLTQSGTDDEEWLQSIKDCLSDWRKYRNSKRVGNALQLLNYIVSIGACDAASVTFKAGNITMFAPTVYKKQILCTDVVDLFATTVIGFIEGGWRAYKQGSASAFFVDEDTVAAFEKHYASCVEHHGYAIAGNLLEYTKIDDNDYELMLDKTIDCGTAIMDSMDKTSTLERKFIIDRLDRIRGMKSEFTQVRSRGGSKLAAFAWVLSGSTGVGKTALNNLSIAAVGGYNKFDVSDSRIATWADNDKYASNVRSHTNVLIFDDCANTQTNFMDFSPCYRLLQAVNNAVFTAPMAEIMLKGKVVLHPYIVAVTTNVEHLCAHIFSNAPESILRRFYHVKVEVKEEYATNGMIDGDKVTKAFGTTNCPDVWKLTVRRCVVIPGIGNTSTKWAFEPILFNKKKLENISVFEYLRWIQIASKHHYEFQREFVKTVRSCNKTKLCSDCGLMFCKGQCMRISTDKPSVRFDDDVKTTILPTLPKNPKELRPNGVKAANHIWDTNLTRPESGPVCFPPRVPKEPEYEHVVVETVNEAELEDNALPSLVTDINTDDDLECQIDLLGELLGQEKHKELHTQALSRFVFRFLFWYATGFCLQVTAILGYRFCFILSHIPGYVFDETNPHRITLTQFFNRYLPYLGPAYWTELKNQLVYNATLRAYYLYILQLEARQRLGLFIYDLRNTPTYHLYELKDMIDDSRWIFDFITWIPDDCMGAAWLRRVILSRKSGFLYDKYWKILTAYALVVIASAVGLFYGHYVHLIPIGAVVFVLSQIFYIEYMEINMEILNRRDAAPTFIKRLRAHYGKILLGSMFGGYAIFKAIVYYRQLYSQGNLSPSNIEEVNARNDEKDMWACVTPDKFYVSDESRTTDLRGVMSVLDKSIVTVTSGEFITRGVVMEGGMLLLPKHYIDNHLEKGISDIRVRCNRRPDGHIGGNFTTQLFKEWIVHIPDTDFVLCYTPDAGTNPRVWKFLPEKPVGNCSAKVVLKNNSHQTTESTVRYVQETVTHERLTFQGGKYNLPYSTFDGMCMSPVVCQGKCTSIVGFHLAGLGVRGASGSLTRAQYTTAVDTLIKRPGVLRFLDGVAFPSKRHCVNVLESGTIHPNNAANFITEANSMDVYGTCCGRATPRSRVVTSVISSSVEHHLGWKAEFGPPNMKDGNYPYHTALEQLAHPTLSLGSKILKPYECFFQQFVSLKAKIPELFRECRPLTRFQSVCGVPGKKFLDRMNMSTVCGWPLKGDKTTYLVELDPKEYPEYTNPVTFVEEIWDEYEAMIRCFQRGERYWAIWKACLKDEVKKVSKALKVRVFQCSPVALQLFLRQYFLPIVRIIQMNPLHFECLVGSNAEGPEWEQLHSYMMSKSDKVLAGDYSKYDQRMPAQLTIAAFKLLIDAAELCPGYKPEDLQLMRACVTEVINPLMAYDGTLLLLYGSNPSGQNLTVIINSFVNSLLLRAAYYDIYPDSPVGDFREHVAVGTYGDDVKGTVSLERPLYNHLSYARFLSQFGMVFTMPDKESEATEFMSDEDSDFLSRADRYCPERNCHVGVLQDASIAKRLHAHLAPSAEGMTMELQAALNIDTTLHDVSLRSREEYNDIYQKLASVAEDCGIKHLCNGFTTYDARLSDWYAKYKPGEAPPNCPNSIGLS